MVRGRLDKILSELIGTLPEFQDKLNLGYRNFLTSNKLNLQEVLLSLLKLENIQSVVKYLIVWKVGRCLWFYCFSPAMIFKVLLCI